MIEFVAGDILRADVEALVNPVNCVGVMGRGVALQVRKAFPENFSAYAAACVRGEVRPGQMFVFETGRLAHPRLIINFPTKTHWRNPSRMVDIEAGLAALAAEIGAHGIRSLAVPALGCGLGGLDWAEVRPRIVEALGGLAEVRVLVFAPAEAPRTAPAAKVPPMTAGRAALVAVVHRYLGGLMDPFVSLLAIHKLMYFLQAAGEPLRLSYVRAPFGPYAENLRHVMHAIEGHLVTGYGDGGDSPSRQIDLVPGSVETAEAFLASMPETRARLARVGQLVDGYESAFGLELLATVHWVARHDSLAGPDDIVAQVHDWNARKKRFTPRQITIALNTLRSHGWLAVLACR